MIDRLLVSIVLIFGAWWYSGYRNTSSVEERTIIGWSRQLGEQESTAIYRRVAVGYVQSQNSHIQLLIKKTGVL
jgi:hypothetical protein